MGSVIFGATVERKQPYGDGVLVQFVLDDGEGYARGVVSIGDAAGFTVGEVVEVTVISAGE